MIFHGIELFIDALDCGRMRRCCDLKVGNFTQLHGGGKMRRRANILCLDYVVGII